MDFRIELNAAKGTAKASQQEDTEKLKREAKARGEYIVSVSGDEKGLLAIAKKFNMSLTDFKNMTGLTKDTLQKGYESKVDFHRTESFYPFQIEQYTVMPLRANHMQSEECHLYIISRDGRTVLYGQDSAMFPEETWEELKLWKFSCVILDCTSVDRDNYFDCHMGIQDNARIKERMIKEGMADEDTKFIATHFAHTFAPYHERLTELFRPYGIIPAYDGMEIEI